MSILSKIASWFKKTEKSNKTSSATSKKALSSASKQSGASYAPKKKEHEEEVVAKQKEVTQKFKTGLKSAQSLAPKNDNGRNTTAQKTSTTDRYANTLAKKASLTKNTVSPKIALQPKEADAFKGKQLANATNLAEKSKKQYSAPKSKETVKSEHATHRQNVKRGYNEWQDNADAVAKKQGVNKAVLQKNGSPELTARAIEWESKYTPTTQAFVEGGLSGATLAASDLLEKRADPRISAALEKSRADRTDSENLAKGVGNFLGSMMTYMNTPMVLETIGGGVAKKALSTGTKNAVKSAAKNSVERMAGSKFISNAAKATGRDSLAVAEDVARAVAQDAGINFTSGLVHTVNRAISNGGTDEEILNQIAKDTGINIALGTVLSFASPFLSSLKYARANKSAERAVNKSLGLRAAVEDTTDNTINDALKEVPLEPKKTGGMRAKIAERKTELLDPTKPKQKKELLSRAEAGDEEAKDILARLNERLSANAESAKPTLPNQADETVQEAKKIIQFAKSQGAEVNEGNWEEWADAYYESVRKRADDMAESAVKSAPEEAPAEYASISDEQFASEPYAESIPQRSDEIATAEKELKDRLADRMDVQYEKTPRGKIEADEASGVGAQETKMRSFEDAMDIDSQYRKSHANENEEEKISRAFTSQSIAVTNEESASIMNEVIRDGDVSRYSPVQNKAGLEACAEMFNENPQLQIDKMHEAAKNIDTLKVSESVNDFYMACYLNRYAERNIVNATGEDKELLNQLLVDTTKIRKTLSSQSGQINQMQGVMVHCDPASRMRMAIDDVADLLNKSMGFTNHKAKKIGLDLSSDRATRLNQIAEAAKQDEGIKTALEKIYKAENKAEFGNAYNELMLAVNRFDGNTAFDYIQEWRYLAMLGNVRTHGRNIIGNIMFGGVRQLSNAVGALLEKQFFKDFAGAEKTRTRGGLSGKAWINAHGEPVDALGEEALDAWRSEVAPRYTSSKFEPQKAGGDGNILTKPLHFLSEVNSKLLTKEDAWFMEWRFREHYIKLYNANKGNISKEELISRARLEAEISTYKEYNRFSEVLNKLSRQSTNAEATFFERGVGKVTNAVFPFAKTSANMMKQSINYSPLGIATGASKIMKASKTENVELLNAAIDEFASGLTGTGIFVAGMIMNNLTGGAFTTNVGNNDYAAKFKKNNGVQNYSVMIGDKSFSLDILAPTACTFFSGVEFDNILRNKGFDITNLYSDTALVLSRMAEPTFETSIFSGIYNAIEGARNSNEDDNNLFFVPLGRELIQSYINSLIPTFQGQVANIAYSSDKQVIGDKDWEYEWNYLKKKAGLGGKLGEKIGLEPLGEDTTANGTVKHEKKTGTDYLKSAARELLSPSNIQDIDLDEGDKARIKEYEEYVRKGGDPEDKKYLFATKYSKKSFSYGKGDGDVVEMSNKDVATFNKSKKNAGEDCATAALGSIIFNRYEYVNGKKVPIGKTEEEKQSIINSFKGKSVRDVANWVYSSNEYKNATEAEKEKVMNLVQSYYQQGESKGAKRAGERAVVEAQGGDVHEYDFKNEVPEAKQEAIQPYIDSGLLSYEDVVTFAREAGKTNYYEDDSGGHSQISYSKKSMTTFLQEAELPYEKAEVLYNSFKQSNAKEYSGASSGSGKGYRRRRGGSSSKSAGTNKSAPKITGLKSATSLAKSSKSSATSLAKSAKQLQRVKAKIDLPNAKY